jgi:hypothetical protein
MSPPPLKDRKTTKFTIIIGIVLTDVESIGGTSVRLVRSRGVLAARLLEMPNNFINTPANSDGAAIKGVSLGGTLRNKDRNELRRLSSSDDGTGEIVANDECMPFGGLMVVTAPVPYRVITAPSRAPASSTDCGISSVGAAMMIAVIFSSAKPTECKALLDSKDKSDVEEVR